MKERIILVGFGGHAKSIIDSMEASDRYEIAGYVDVDNRTNYKGYCFLGKDEDLQKIYLSGINNACISIGYMGGSNLRDRLYHMVKKAGFNLPVITDPSAIISDNVEIGEGTFIGKGCIVNAESRIGKMCIINTGVLIEHGNTIGDFTHIAVKAVLCGGTNIGNHCFIGANSTIIQEVAIGNNTIIGAGSTVLKNVLENEICYGIVGRSKIFP